jgi:DNA-binding HxlR family transcriptional regulator
MIKRNWNTKEKGIMEFIFYKEKGKYIGVCLSFDIVEEGKDLTNLIESVEDVAKLHLRTVTKNNLSDDLLNRYAPEEYWNKYFAALKALERQKVEEKKVEAEIPAIVNLPYPTIGMNQFTVSGV